MTKFLKVLERDTPPENKQARELWVYATQLHGHNKFDKSVFLKNLKEQKGKDTALKNSIADPSLTFNYYLPGLINYDFMEMYEDDVKLPKKKGAIDPFNRTRKTVTKLVETHQEEHDRLSKRIESDMARMEELEALMAAKASDATVTENTDTAEAPETNGEDTNSDVV